MANSDGTSGTWVASNGGGGHTCGGRICGGRTCGGSRACCTVKRGNLHGHHRGDMSCSLDDVSLSGSPNFDLVRDIHTVVTQKQSQTMLTVISKG